MIPADVVALGMPLPSAANLREHKFARARRVKRQRAAGYALTLSATTREERAALLVDGVVVTLTRQSPRALDDDNLASAFKAVRDGVADALDIDDRDPRVAWRTVQVRGPVAVRIRLEPTAWAREAGQGAEGISAREAGPDVVDYTGTRVQRKIKGADSSCRIPRKTATAHDGKP